MADENTEIDPGEVGIAAYELVTQMMIELGWDMQKRKGVYERAAATLDHSRPGAAAAVRSISKMALGS